MIAIDKNIPMPARSYGGRTKYPFHTMEVGDSFAVGLSGEDTTDTLAKRVRTAMGAAAELESWLADPASSFWLLNPRASVSGALPNRGTIQISYSFFHS